MWVNPRDGQPYARVWWYDETGRRKEKRQRAASRQDAKDLGRDLLEEVRATAGKSLERARTFAELAAHYSAQYVKAAEYAEGRKVAGLRSHRTVKIQLEALKKHFADKPLRSIRFE